MENNDFLSKQIITYIGNKRLLLNEISQVIKDIQLELKVSKTKNADLFAGSGIVSRLLKQYSHTLISNDLEYYSYLINSCYLSNRSEFDLDKYQTYYQRITNKLAHDPVAGLISEYYAPKDNECILKEDRVFYTKENALIIDTIRAEIDHIEPSYQKYFLAPLLYAASVNVNTAGVFKGFYKDKDTKIGKFGGKNEDALSRIIKPICLEQPIFSDYETNVILYNNNAYDVALKEKDFDIVYLDPPYNQHPYGSNYFMLNVIAHNKIESEMSKVSGIPNNWNRSNYNKKQFIKQELDDLINQLDTKYIILSYNSEGFLKYDEIVSVLNDYGQVKVKEINYNTYRGSRNLNNRSLYVKEYLFILKKDK